MVDERTIDASQLLRIDIAAEIAKVAQAQQEGPWTLPAELVRRGIRSGATAVEIRLRRNHVQVKLRGGDISREVLQALAVLLDLDAPDSTRHGALVAMEVWEESALLGLAALDVRELDIRTSTGHRLHHRIGAAASLSDEVPRRTTEVTVHCGHLDPKRAAGWLRSTCRFAPVPIDIDGVAVAKGFEEALVRTAVAPPHRGEIGIPLHGEMATVSLLQHGVVTAQLAVPGAPCFLAAVELGEKISRPDPAHLRAVFPELAPALAEQAVDLLINASYRCAQSSERSRHRLGTLLLRMLRHRHRLRELVTVPLFRAFDPDGGIRLVDLLTLRSWVHRDRDGSMVLAAVFPQATGSVVTNRPIAVLDETERSLLALQLHVRFQAPQASPGAWSLDPLRWGARLRTSLQLLWSAVRHPGAMRPLADEMLTAAERRVLEVLRERTPGGMPSIHMCAGRGPIRRRGGPTPRVLLPREDPDVKACVRAIATDGSWAYPAAYLLLERFARPSRDSRVQWFQRLSRAQ